MSHETVNLRDVDPISEAMGSLEEPLDCEQLGLTAVE